MSARFGSVPGHVQVDSGLRAYMLRVYDFLGVGLGVSAVSAYVLMHLATTTIPVEGAKAFSRHLWLTPVGETLFSGWAMLAVFGVSVALLFGIGKSVRDSSLGTALAMYVAFTGLFGINLAMVCASYTSQSVTSALAVTAATFGAMSLWGYTTRSDLTGWGSFLFMGLLGLIGTGLVNVLFLHSSVLQTATSAAGVLVFVGFTAYDTQKIKEAYSPALDGEERNLVALWGALDLYLDVLNLFLNLIQLLGDKDD